MGVRCFVTEFSIIVQFITGHNFLKRQETLIKYGEDEEVCVEAACQHCDIGEAETSFHILARCPAFGTQRFSIWGREELELPFNDLKCKEIIQFLRELEDENILSTLDFKI